MSRVHKRTPLRVAAPPVLRFEHDVAAGLVSFVHEEDAGELRIDSHGWEFGGRLTRRYTIRPEDPTSARLELRNVEVYGRDGGPRVRVETATSMTADEEDFHLKARLDAYEDGRPVFTRSWLEKIPRDGV